MPEPIPADLRVARRDVAKLVTERNAVLRDAARAGVVDQARLDAVDARIAAVLDKAIRRVDPCDASEAEPLVLLPVRLETRFGAGNTLRVRIYPDEIHVDELARGLADAEMLAGQTYWTAAWAEPVPEGAWETLVTAVGPSRAEWVAHVTTPENLSARGTGEPPAFGAVDAPGPRNVVARALPDRFVVLAIQGGQVSRQVGAAIPRDLALSPVPLEGDQPQRLADALTLVPGTEWLVDYDRAVAVGMGVTVTLAGGAAPVDRVIALGTRSSLSAAAGATELEDLLTGHRFGDGLGWLAQGTPTNNADAERSPLRARAAPEAPPLTAPAAVPGSDTAAAAELLGVDATLLTGLVGPGTGEQALARDVNTALWAPGWGEFLSRLDGREVPGVDDAQRESARELFRDHVRGRGTAPALRVGAQPYGLLAASDLDAWAPRAGETTAGVLSVVRKLLGRWSAAAEQRVPRVRGGQSGLDQTVLEVLGSSPVLQGLRVRPVVSDDVSEAVVKSLGLDGADYQAEKTLATAVAATLAGSAAGKLKLGSLHKDTRPLPLPLASARDAEFIAALLGSPSKVLAIDSVLQALLALAWDSSELDVAKAAPAQVLPALLEYVEIEPALKVQVAALAARADTAEPQELLGAVERLQASGVVAAGTSVLRSYQPIEQVQTSVAEIALSAPVSKEAKVLGAAALAGWLVAMGYRSEVRAAMHRLAGSDLTARSLAVAEALDCSSHRLDAWATAIVADRRARQAAGAPRGLTLGAYGVVENVRPRAATAGDGWIHAPSSQHAVAAGMLRSAQLAHQPAVGGGPFAIDLSSRRLQTALKVIEGVRQGQPLGALIGYQIERGLAEAGLARLQLSLRTLAPLVAHRLHDTAGDDRSAQEALAATNVVDGVLLLKRFTPGDVRLRIELDKPPENAYLDPGDWTALTQAEFDTVTRLLRAAADTIDAVADALLSESVLQYAGGNAQRAAAAMDAMGSGASPADALDVLEAHDPGERLTHRVLAVVGADATAAPGWNALRPRALLEPRLEAWAAAHLGDPAQIVVGLDGAERITLDQAGLCALDLVSAPDLLVLERTLRRALPAVTELAVKRDPKWPAAARALGQVMALAGALRGTISGGKELSPSDLTRPDGTPARDLAAALPELTGRVTALIDGLTAEVSALEATIAAFPPDDIVADEATADAIAAAAFALEPFGVPLDPVPDRPLDVAWVRSAWEIAGARAERARAVIAAIAPDTPPALVVDELQRAAGVVLGDGFLVVPLLDAAGDDLVDAVGAPAFPPPAASAVRRFVRDHSTVRRQLTRLSEALLLEGALGHPRGLSVAQLVVPGTPGTDRWLAGPLPATGPWPDSPVAHVVLDTVGTVDAATALAGFVVDAWTEDLPAQVGPEADPDDPRPGRVPTGLALRCNAASARPPQSVLCAISPNGRRWTTDALRGVVEQTLELAKVRLLTLERLPGDGLVLPALYTRSSSLQGSQYLTWAKLASEAVLNVPVPFVKEVKS